MARYGHRRLIEGVGTVMDRFHVVNRTCRACDGPLTGTVCDDCGADQEEMAEAEHEAARERYFTDLARLRLDRMNLGIARSARRNR